MELPQCLVCNKPHTEWWLLSLSASLSSSSGHPPGSLPQSVHTFPSRVLTEGKGATQ